MNKLFTISKQPFTISTCRLKRLPIFCYNNPRPCDHAVAGKFSSRHILQEIFKISLSQATVPYLVVFHVKFIFYNGYALEGKECGMTPDSIVGA